MIAAPFGGLIDLHTHTSSSDSPVSPVQLIVEARQFRVRWLAVTDHDAVAALPQCIDVAARLGVELIPAVEITAITANGENVHILGYGLDPDGAARLHEALASVRLARTAACRKAVETLRAEGYDVTWPQVLQYAKGTGVFKVHIMHALMSAGYADRIKGLLYSKLCAPGGPLAERSTATPAELAIRLVHQSGGAAVLAHPGLFGGLALCEELVDLGLDGIEAYHPAHGQEVVEEALACAREYGLVATGGSDYHGAYGDYDVKTGCPQLTQSHLSALFERIGARRELARGEAALANGLSRHIGLPLGRVANVEQSVGQTRG